MKFSEREQAQSLLDLLVSVHADQYQGLDDEMADDCNEWIASLSDDELSDIVLRIFHKGI